MVERQEAVIIINVRGTSGAGKSTLARQLLSLYPGKSLSSFLPTKTGGQSKRPFAVTYFGEEGRRPLYTLGHYEIPCGGADTVSSRNRDEVFKLLQEAHSTGVDVFYEGVIYSDEVTRTVALCKGQSHAIIRLKTPIETCIERVKQRRVEAGNVETFNDQITRSRHEAIIRACGRLKDAGLQVHALESETAFIHIRSCLCI